jgi:hypothetical protein
MVEVSKKVSSEVMVRVSEKVAGSDDVKHFHVKMWVRIRAFTCQRSAREASHKGRGSALTEPLGSTCIVMPIAVSDLGLGLTTEKAWMIDFDAPRY